MEDLDGYRAVQLVVASLIDVGHPPPGQVGRDFIAVIED
jgi:hypothetical protein